MATADQLKTVCRILNSRGREATPEQVQAFLDDFKQKRHKAGCTYYPDTVIVKAIQSGQKTLTMCLHLYFGDAL